MIPEKAVVRRSARRAAEAADRLMGEYLEELHHDEPDISGRLVERIANSLNGESQGDLQWQGKVFSSHGLKSEEATFGADVLGLLEIATADIQVRKGFLAQAKMVKPGERINLVKLQHQCEDMLKVSPDSFVFLYRLDMQAVRVVPALSIVRAKVPPIELYDRSLQAFLELHFECFIGDHRLASPRRVDLDAVRAERDARHLLYLRASTLDAQGAEPW